MTFLALVIKPVREWIFDVKAVRKGQQALLRDAIVRTYYKNIERKTLEKYEYENLTECYAAYIANKGNSFVKHIFAEMQTWEITK